jgi:hypothetical protein
MEDSVFDDYGNESDVYTPEAVRLPRVLNLVTGPVIDATDLLLTRTTRNQR